MQMDSKVVGEVLQDLQISVSLIVQFQLGKKEQEFWREMWWGQF